MSIAYGPRKEAPELAVVTGETFGEVLDKKGLRAQWELVCQYNWGTKVPEEINRALIELVGCEDFNSDPLDTVLDPDRGTGGKIYEPKAWAPTQLDAGKVHTVTVKKRLPATAASILSVPFLFDPDTEFCDIDYRLEGDPTRVETADLEVHVASYWGLTGRSSPAATEPDVEEFVTSYYDEVKAADDRHLAEYVEKPCGTFSKDNIKETHLFRDTQATPRGTFNLQWDGASQATEGVLKPGDLITSRCAPYLVAVRYYKDPADKTTFLRMYPFYPQWKLTGRDTWELIEKSMIVQWKVEGEETSRAKLKNGQIRVYEKDSLVFFAPLTAEQIESGKYDLLNEAIPWDASQVDMKELPYRIQIQVHSNDEEDNGLALAVMPTQVPGYDYESVQFIGFNIRNDSKAPDYLGHADDDTDIDFRVDAMIQAIESANGSGQIDTDRNVLKVFVAPEFYFRGKKGAYRFEKISTIVPKLRKTTDALDYLDWLFVFGTALGSYGHSDGTGAIVHGNAKHLIEIASVQPPDEITARVWSAPEQGWELHTSTGELKTIVAPPPPLPPDADPVDGFFTINLKLDNTTNLVPTIDKRETWIIQPVMTIDSVDASAATKVVVKNALCGRIPVSIADNTVTGIAGGFWEAESDKEKRKITKVDFDGVDKYTLTLDASAPFLAGKPLLLHEPKTTEIFNAALMQKGWHAPHLGDGSLRQVTTYKEFISPIDFVRNSNLDFHVSTGINRKVRLNSLSDSPVLPTEGGRDIGGASPNATRLPDSNVGSEINATGIGGGCVIMVDRVSFGMEVCLDHAKNRLFDFYTGPNVRSGDPLVQVQLIPSWGMSIGNSAAGKEVTAVRDALVFNVDGSRMESVARVWDGEYSCDTHSSVATGAAGECTKPKTEFAEGNWWYVCADCPPNARYKGAPCTVHPPLKACAKPLRRLGTALAPVSRDTVDPANRADYFRLPGNVEVFPAVALPEADVATTPPVLTGITNGSQQQGLSVEVTFQGSGLADARYVNISGAGVYLTAMSLVDDANFKATLFVANTAAVGARNLTVSSLSGTSATAVVFNVVARAVPTIVSVTPNVGEIHGTYDVEIVGTNFRTCSNIRISDPGVNWTFVSLTDDKIKIKVHVLPTAVLGAAVITVTTIASATGVFTVKARPRPSVNFSDVDDFVLSFSYGPMQIMGAHFLDATGVAVHGGGVTVDTFHVDSDNEITLELRVDETAVVGDHELIVTTPSGDSLPFPVTVSAPPIPTLISISPVSVYGGFPWTFAVTGTDLITLRDVMASAAGVVIEDVMNHSNGGFDLSLRIDETADLGDCEVTVRTLGGNSAPIYFEIGPPPAPTLNRIVPNEGIAGRTVQVTIEGMAMMNFKTLDIAGDAGVTVSSIVSVDYNKVVARLLIAVDALAGDRAITVTNHGGESEAVVFTVKPVPEPVLDAVSPDNGGASYGVDLELRGRNLTGCTAINISGEGIRQGEMTVRRDDLIDVRISIAVDAEQTERDITVTTAGGTSRAVKFKVKPRRAPTVRSVSPRQVRQNTGGNCFLSGSDMAEAGTVTCSTDKIVVTGVARDSSTRIHFTIAVAADAPIGLHTLTYTNRFGSATTTLEVIA